ncbi:MAG: hypothetical protein D3903_17740 [Candidatus Electrothrix sp. GM3_4]|nr:hypothetical protein [Candidatus Electrothrix sp. GM3_4]
MFSVPGTCSASSNPALSKGLRSSCQSVSFMPVTPCTISSNPPPANTPNFGNHSRHSSGSRSMDSSSEASRVRSSRSAGCSSSKASSRSPKSAGRRSLSCCASKPMDRG